MKNVLGSTTIIGVLIAIFAKVLGLATEEELTSIADQVKALWPVLVGIGADLVAAWQRVKATRFDVAWYKSRTLWAGVVSAVMTFAAAFGVDISGLQSLFDKSLETWPALVALGGSLLTILGRFNAKKRIEGSPSRIL